MLETPRSLSVYILILFIFSYCESYWNPSGSLRRREAGEHQAPVAQKLDSAIHQINPYPVDRGANCAIQWIEIYPVDDSAIHN